MSRRIWRLPRSSPDARLSMVCARGCLTESRSASMPDTLTGQSERPQIDRLGHACSSCTAIVRRSTRWRLPRGQLDRAVGDVAPAKRSSAAAPTGACSWADAIVGRNADRPGPGLVDRRRCDHAPRRADATKGIVRGLDGTRGRKPLASGSNPGAPICESPVTTRLSGLWEACRSDNAATISRLVPLVGRVGGRASAKRTRLRPGFTPSGSGAT